MRENTYLLVAGTGLLFVAGVGLVHTLAYKGMGIFVGYDANLPAQVWVACPRHSSPRAPRWRPR